MSWKNIDQKAEAFKVNAWVQQLKILGPIQQNCIFMFIAANSEPCWPKIDAANLLSKAHTAHAAKANRSFLEISYIPRYLQSKFRQRHTRHLKVWLSSQLGEDFLGDVAHVDIDQPVRCMNLHGNETHSALCNHYQHLTDIRAVRSQNNPRGEMWPSLLRVWHSQNGLVKQKCWAQCLSCFCFSQKIILTLLRLMGCRRSKSLPQNAYCFHFWIFDIPTILGVSCAAICRFFRAPVKLRVITKVRSNATTVTFLSLFCKIDKQVFSSFSLS